MKTYFSLSSHINRTVSEKELERNALLSDLEKTKKALEIAYAGFDNVTEPDLIDCYIYEVNSVLKRYKFLMEQAARLYMLPEENKHISHLCEKTPAAALVSQTLC
ncbi:MAG: YaaL family protein [Lachnospiraceae bacterium]|nr:YaaL family protein [Lachnospiraceae bacterium]